MRNTRYVDPFTFQRAKYWSRFSREIINSDSTIPNLPTRIPYSEGYVLRNEWIGLQN